MSFLLLMMETKESLMYWLSCPGSMPSKSFPGFLYLYYSVCRVGSYAETIPPEGLVKFGKLIPIHAISTLSLPLSSSQWGFGFSFKQSGKSSSYASKIL